MYQGDIEKNTQDEAQPTIILYNIHKYINADADLTMVQWRNNPYIGNIYNKLSNTKHTWGAHSVNGANVSHIT